MTSKPCGLLLALAGPELSSAEAEMLSHPAVLGLTLFGRNIQSLTQLQDLIAAIRTLNPQLVIAVDQEGGRVQRIREGVSRLPALHGIGQRYAHEPDVAMQLAHDHALVMASELKVLDVDLSFAPVVDTWNPLSQVIGDRAFSDQPEVICELAEAYIAGMNAAGMVATLKHFPGHGGVAGDTHIERPVDGRSRAVILSEDGLPYSRLLDARSTTVMCSHVVYSQVDSAPASFSRQWIDGILRQELGFDGVVMSDDLGMQAAVVADSLLERAQRACAAGCDLLLVCESEPAQALVAQWPAVAPDARVAATLRGQLLANTANASDDEALDRARQRLKLLD